MSDIAKKKIKTLRERDDYISEFKFSDGSISVMFTYELCIISKSGLIIWH